MSAVYRIAPFEFLHVLDQNSNITKVVCGPQTFVTQDNEKVILGPEKMIIIPPLSYCVVDNPVIVKGNEVQFDKNAQAQLRFGSSEVRLTRDPFPLYPGEVMRTPVTALTLVEAEAALRLVATLDFKDGEVTRHAGDEWLFKGPGLYIPRVEARVVEAVRAVIITPNTALRMRARNKMEDSEGNVREAGEEWLITKVGAYIPDVDEEVIGTVLGQAVTERAALHLRATRTFTDAYGKTRKAGEEWLLTSLITSSHIASVYEQVVGVVNMTVVSSRQYLVIVNPCDEEGHPMLGQRKLVIGPATFFLQPGELIEANKIQDIHVLGVDEGVILRCNEPFSEGETERNPGDRWMVRGPCEYVPPVQVEIVSKQKAIPLDKNEGIYVRDIKTGKVRAIVGQTYLLDQNEELFEKDLPHDALLPGGAKRDKTRVVTLSVPHNAAVQVYNFREKKARIVFGPELVMLNPDEQFTVMSLSGGKPKVPHQIKALYLMLGPEFSSDIVTIETSDHARLSLHVSYNWHFEVNRKDEKEASKIFAVPDFIGDFCKALASRIRGAVASITFDEFHKNSAKIIRKSVFGVDANDKINAQLDFPANNLVVTGVDIQSVEPVDQRTRDSLLKSVQLAIEITTKSQEAKSHHDAQRREQEARGRLDQQRLEDDALIEDARKKLLELQALTASIESTGTAKAEAQSRADALKIEGEANVQLARLRVQAAKIDAEIDLEVLQTSRDAEMKYSKELNDLEIEKSQALKDIESKKFEEMVKAIGKKTIQAIACAGPQMQERLLKSLGLQTTLITDGKSPINLFNTANGLISKPSFSSSS